MMANQVATFLEELENDLNSTLSKSEKEYLLHFLIKELFSYFLDDVTDDEPKLNDEFLAKRTKLFVRSEIHDLIILLIGLFISQDDEA